MTCFAFEGFPRRCHKVICSAVKYPKNNTRLNFDGRATFHINVQYYGVYHCLAVVETLSNIIVRHNMIILCLPYNLPFPSSASKRNAQLFYDNRRMRFFLYGQLFFFGGGKKARGARLGPRTFYFAHIHVGAVSLLLPKQ